MSTVTPRLFTYFRLFPYSQGTQLYTFYFPTARNEKIKRKERNKKKLRSIIFKKNPEKEFVKLKYMYCTCMHACIHACATAHGKEPRGAGAGEANLHVLNVCTEVYVCK